MKGIPTTIADPEPEKKPERSGPKGIVKGEQPDLSNAECE